MELQLGFVFHIVGCVFHIVGCVFHIVVCVCKLVEHFHKLTNATYTVCFMTKAAAAMVQQCETR